MGDFLGKERRQGWVVSLHSRTKYFVFTFITLELEHVQSVHSNSELRWLYDHYLNVRTRERRLRLKPALVQDTDYMVEKTDQLAPYVAAFGVFLMPQ